MTITIIKNDDRRRWKGYPSSFEGTIAYKPVHWGGVLFLVSQRARNPCGSVLAVIATEKHIVVP